QPVYCHCLHTTGGIAVAHNGNLINTEELRSELIAEGVDFESSNDSEVIARLIVKHRDNGLPTADALRETMKRIRGAYSLAVLSETELVAARDPYGVRPLCLGRLGSDHWVIASETCALNTVGATFVRDINPGEIVLINAEGVRRVPGVPLEGEALCMLEM